MKKNKVFTLLIVFIFLLCELINCSKQFETTETKFRLNLDGILGYNKLNRFIDQMYFGNTEISVSYQTTTTLNINQIDLLYDFLNTINETFLNELENIKDEMKEDVYLKKYESKDLVNSKYMLIASKEKLYKILKTNFSVNEIVIYKISNQVFSSNFKLGNYPVFNLRISKNQNSVKFTVFDFTVNLIKYKW